MTQRWGPFTNHHHAGSNCTLGSNVCCQEEAQDVSIIWQSSHTRDLCTRLNCVMADLSASQSRKKTLLRWEVHSRFTSSATTKTWENYQSYTQNLITQRNTAFTGSQLWCISTAGLLKVIQLSFIWHNHFSSLWFWKISNFFQMQTSLVCFPKPFFSKDLKNVKTLPDFQNSLRTWCWSKQYLSQTE